MRALNPARRDLAVVLNANAKKVTPRLRARVEEKVRGADIYYSRSVEEGRTIARRILSEGYSAVLTGGGDGTFIQMVNELYRLTQRLDVGRQSQGEVLSLDRQRTSPIRGQRRTWLPQDMPQVGILRLGTGNAVANVVSAGDYIKDIQKIQGVMEQGRAPDAVRIPVMEAERQVFPFAGLGWDGAVLNDYMSLKERFAGTPLEALVKSAAGYILAAALRTAPRLMVEPSPRVEITCVDESFALDSSGRRVARFGPGDVMYRGPANMVCFGTVPFIGARVKLFPHATTLDAFQMRVVRITSAEAFLNLPRQWFGRYHSPRIHEFHVRRARLSFDRPVPYQLGGDAMGSRQMLEVGLSTHPLDVVDFKTSPDRRGMLPAPAAAPALRSIPGGR